ncbi:hypothetical protein B0A50_07318 [Salinomyces thailandicus]|uniref:Telomere replication protein EST3 n=1 Tax=Salinomyces thailandicus TaxID=706561 RepID=A0A4U0TMQ3_9PEZI|nr:hypothetical protein B0A50_07318 [Salinomyces thailandica]
MAKSIQPWLGAFVHGELAAVVQWTKSSHEAPNIKTDPDTRFHDDGSNFRSAVSTPPLSVESKVQLLKVLAIGTSPIVVLSDGASSMKARLSDHAVTVLEDELEESLSLEMRGDVFSLVAVNVVSTPVGPADGHVQLEVEDLQYQYHLRKTAGTPIPIERQTEVSGLVDAIRNIRVRQYTDEEPLTTTLPKAALRSISPQASLGAHQRAAAHAEERLPSTAMSQDGAQSQSLHGSPVLQTQAPVATQVNPPPRKAKKGPSLAVEGFEMTTGLNLAKPSAPALDSTPQVVSNPKRTAKLLDLLGGPSKAPPLLSSAAPSVDVNIESEDQAPPNQPSRASRLSQKHSWYPPLPGQQFPTPNIPIELLQAWTSNGEESSRKPQQTSEVARQVSEDQQSGDHSTLQEYTIASQGSVKRAVTFAAQAFEKSTSQPGSQQPGPDNRHQQPLNGKQHARGTSGRSGPGGVDARQASTSSPRSSGLATVIKGTQFSNEGSEMEVDVPRPLTDPREKHHAKRTQHFKGAQRKTWLLSHYIVSYEAGPYVSAVHEAYLATHPDDKVTWLEFREDLNRAFPSLLGQDRPRSLKPKGMPPSLISTPASSSREMADIAPGAANRVVVTTPLRRKPEFAVHANERLLRESKRLGGQLDGAISPTTSSRQPPSYDQPRSQIPSQITSSSNGHTTHPTAPTAPSIFDDFAHAWKDLKPGGAFAQPTLKPNHSRISKTLNLLAWKL